MECSALAIYTPLAPEEASLPVRVFHFPGLPETWQDVTVKQCFLQSAGTGASVWHASAQLALYLSATLAGRRGKALELGCGLGLVSMVLSIAGFDVLATDGNETVLECTQANIQENGLSGLTATQHYLWYSPPRNSDPATDAILARWGRFDLIVAADVLYGEYEHMEDFVRTLERMADERTEVFVAQKVRYPAREEKLRERLMQMFELEWITPDLLCSNLGKQSIYILKKKMGQGTVD